MSSNYLKKDLREAKRLLYICDNCGEIVLDKLFVEQIIKEYPKLDIQVMVRGGEVINDASMINAMEVGFDKVCKIIDNGVAMAGSDIKHMSPSACNTLKLADVVISKGQANFETLYGNGYPIYYMLLCKCDLFVSRFNMERFKGIFIKEDRIAINNK